MTNPEREAWKDEVLESLQGLEPFRPDPFLFTRIQSRISSSDRPAALVARIPLGASLVGLFLLAALNVAVIVQAGPGIDANASPDTGDAYEQTLTSDFGLYSQ